MRNVWKWVVIVGGLLVVVFLAALFLFGNGFFHMGGFYGSMPMMDGHFRGGPYMYNSRGIGLFGNWLLVFGMFLVPLVLIGLVAVGVIMLVRTSNRPQQAVSPAPAQPVGKICPQCGKPVQADWVNCPYCGEKL